MGKSAFHLLRTTVDPLEPRLLLAAAITPIGTQPTGALTGKIIFTHGGHGYTAANTTTGGWSTQRGLNNGMVEDFGNQEQMTAYVNYLWNAGATIVPMRPVGNQPNEVVLDNDSPGVTFTGAWSNSTSTIFFGTAGDVPYRFASTSATETAIAKYTPNIPAAGFYPVYAWAQDGTNRATDQLYRITHSGGATEVRINHRRVGKGWVYLGTYHFEQGVGGFVEISNKSTSASSVVIADAIRFGNGMGDVNRGGGISGRTREDEASLYWIMRSAGVGTPASVYAPFADDGTNNVGAPPRWAAYMNAQGQGPATDRLFLSFHSNAGGGRGTLGLFNDPGNATANQQAWAELVGREINDDMVAIGSPPLESPWFDRTVVTLNRSDIDFGEIDSGSINNEMDATIVEVAFHDNATDAALMRDPKVRDWLGRAAYQASVRYFATFPAAAPVNLLPGAPTGIRTSIAANGDVTVSWTAPPANSYVGQAATGYRLYASKNGYGFDGGIPIAGGATTSYTIPAALLDNGIYYFRIAAINSGGESPPSEVAAARKPAVARPQVLIVNGFDRLDRAQDIHQSMSLTPGGALVTVDRVRPRLANSFDYVVQHAGAIVAAGGDVEINSAANEVVISGQVNLQNYAAVFWIAGEESAGDDTFNATEQTLVRNYLDGGGKLFVSGAEIGWDLVAQNNGATFYNQALKASYVSDDANTYSASGAAGSIFAGIALNFDNGTQVYNVDFADVISPAGGSTLAMTYSTGGGAAIQYASSNQRLIMLAFPFETITSGAARASVMDAALTFFKLNPAVPPTPDLAPASDSGIWATDNITNRDNSSPAQSLQFVIGGTTPGATVRVFSDGTLIGSAIAAGASTTITTTGAFDLTDGAHNITATQLLGGNESIHSPALSITIDTAAPAVDIVDVSPDPRSSAVSSIAINFNEAISGFALDDLTLRRNGTFRALGGIVNLNSSDNRNWLLDNLSTLTQTSGQYVLDLNHLSAGITDLAGNQLGQSTFDQWFTTTPWFEGTNSSNQYTIRFIQQDGLIEVTESTIGSPTRIYTFQRSALTFLNLQTLGGDDLINVDLTGTNLTIQLDGGSGADTLNINGGAVHPSPATGAVIVLENLTVQPSAVLDLGTGSMILQPAAAQRDALFGSMISLIRSGRNGGRWDGQGIRSSAAALDSQRITGVGLFLNNPVVFSSFAGQPIDSNSILLSYTLTGDADLDGDIDADDYARIDAAYATGAMHYQNGDFDFSGGRPDGDDYFLIDRAFSNQIAVGFASLTQVGFASRPGSPTEPHSAAAPSRSVSRPTHHRSPRRVSHKPTSRPRHRAPNRDSSLWKIVEVVRPSSNVYIRPGVSNL